MVLHFNRLLVLAFDDFIGVRGRCKSRDAPYVGHAVRQSECRLVGYIQIIDLLLLDIHILILLVFVNENDAIECRYAERCRCLSNLGMDRTYFTFGIEISCHAL